MPFSVAIIGAGPAGLTLARLLQVSAIEVDITVFEKDASPTARFFQGGSLDLHTETGLAALKKADLWDEAFKHLRYDGEELRIGDKNATIMMHVNDSSKPKTAAAKYDYERPEIDREVLKDILLKSIKPEWVKWGKTLQSIEPSTGILSFRDGTTAGPFDLVVGADGAWSKVRHVLTDVRPQYAGICGFEGRIVRPDEFYPELSKMVGRGSYFAYSDCKMLSTQRMGTGNLKVGMWLKKADGANYPADMINAYGANEEELKEKILEHYQDWDPKMKQWIQVCGQIRGWPLYELPVGHTWEHKKGFTLIGDAASLMTPFAGEGVNKAMKDALELAEALEKALEGKSNGDSDIVADDEVRKYEVNMFPRAKKYQMRTMQNKTAMFSPNGTIAFMVSLVDLISAELGYDIKKGWLSWIPLKTIVFSYAWTVQTIGSWRRRGRELFSKQSQQKEGRIQL